jgi:hypothetical protein
MKAAALQCSGQQRLTADGGDFRDRALPRGLLHGELHERLPCLRVIAVEPAIGQPRLTGCYASAKQPSAAPPLSTTYSSIGVAGHCSQ